MAKRKKRAKKAGVRKGVRRGRKAAGAAGLLPIAAIEKMLAAQQRRLAALRRRRAKLASQLDKLDGQIAVLSGSAPANGRKRRGPGRPAKAKAPVGRPPKAAGKGKGRILRPRKGATLGNKLVELLNKAGAPMKMQDIIVAVQKSDYPSKSPHLRSMISQTLNRDTRFRKVRRGIYKVA